MKKQLVSILLLGAFHTFAADDGELERLAQMTEAVQTKSIEEFMAAVRENKWAIPRIPSKWHVETKVTDEDEQRRLFAARDFGFQLALRLDVLAKEQQTLPQDSSLFQRTLLLCDAGDWCAQVAGYGNILLARRCLDLAAVGLARLTANMEFPLDECAKIIARMGLSLVGMEYLLRVLNDEANATIFINPKITREQLDQQWGIGWVMRALAEDPTLAAKRKEWGFRPSPPDSKLVNVKAFKDNLNLFKEVPHLPPGTLLTISHTWEYSWHTRLRLNFEILTREKAMYLFKFRSVVGFYPPPFKRTEEEIRKRDAEIEEAAKWGRKITKSEDSPSYDPLKVAFRLEWEKHVKSVAERNKNEDTGAYQAYKEVLSNTFFDFDTVMSQTPTP